MEVLASCSSLLDGEVLLSYHDDSSLLLESNMRESIRADGLLRFSCWGHDCYFGVRE
jgi:hypothetical protein